MSIKEDNVSLLKRVREMCLNGQVASAELELHSVHRRAGCAATTKIILAALLARRGQHKDAGTILKDVKAETVGQCCPSQVRLAVSILVSLGEQDRADRVQRSLSRGDARFQINEAGEARQTVEASPVCIVNSND